MRQYSAELSIPWSLCRASTMSASFSHHDRPLVSYVVLLKNSLRCIIQLVIMINHVNRVYANGPARVDASGESAISVQVAFAVRECTRGVFVCPRIVCGEEYFDDVDGSFSF